MFYFTPAGMALRIKALLIQSSRPYPTNDFGVGARPLKLLSDSVAKLLLMQAGG